MGQKVNPLVLRFNQSIEQSGSLPSIADYKNSYYKNNEVKSFIQNLLKQKAITARNLCLFWSPSQLIVKGDLFFSSSGYVDLKLDYAKSLFKASRAKYSNVVKFNDAKLLSEIVKPTLIHQSRKYKNGRVLNYYFQVNSKLPMNKSQYRKGVYGFLAKSNSKVVSNQLQTKACLDKVFNYRQLELSPQQFLFRQRCHKSSLVSLKFLNRLTESIIAFTGLKKVNLEFTSSQLTYSPYFWQFLRRIENQEERKNKAGKGKNLRNRGGIRRVKQLFSFFLRNKELKPFVWEGIELFYFAFASYGNGNSYLIGNYIKSLFQNVRRQATVLRFLKFLMSFYFTKMPANLRRIDGMRVILKGRVGKAPRSKKVTLSFGQISLQTINAPLDYYQTFAITANGSFGIKVFLAKSAQSIHHN